jgi:hypothetical protein
MQSIHILDLHLIGWDQKGEFLPIFCKQLYHIFTFCTETLYHRQLSVVQKKKGGTSLLPEILTREKNNSIIFI